MSFAKPILLANTFPALHGARVLAIVAVVNFHVVFYTQGSDSAWAHASQRLWFGMDFFFVLSGFLIGSILLNSRSLAEPGGVGRFYVRRALRTFPAYYAVLGLLVLIDFNHGNRSLIWRELLYLTNYPHRVDYFMHWSWSLSLEEHFYALCPLFLLLLGGARRRLYPTMGVLFLTPLALRSLALQDVGGFSDFFSKVYAPTHMRFDTLVAGIMLAHWHHTRSEPLRRLFTKMWARVLFPAAGIGLLFLAFWQFRLGFTGLSGADWQPGAYYVGTVTSVAYVCLILWLLYDKSPVHRFLSRPAFRLLATLGYGVYLVHIPVITYIYAPFRTVVFGHAWALAATLLLSLAAAYILHLTVEKPCLALRDRLDARPAKASGAAADFAKALLRRSKD